MKTMGDTMKLRLTKELEGTICYKGISDAIKDMESAEYQDKRKNFEYYSKKVLIAQSKLNYTQKG
jgi:hypothetical protein